MKKYFHRDTTKKRGVSGSSPIKVSMHVRGVVRTDERVLREARALVEGGFAVSIVDIESEQTSPSEEDFGSIHVRHIVKPHWYIPVSVHWKVFRSIEKFMVSTLAMLRIPTDIYHAHDVNALLPCYLAAIFHHKPLIFDAHELPLHELEHSSQSLVSKVLIYLFTKIVSRCSGIITVSPPIAEEISKYYKAQNIVLVRNIPAYQTTQKTDRLRKHLHLDPEIRIALYQGNIQPDRQLDKLVHAAASLNPDIRIVLMGKDIGETGLKLESLAVEEGVVDRIKIIPPVPYAELLEWTASADIGLIIYEPGSSLNVQMCLPNKFFEYLMAGLPVLTSQLPAVAEIINSYGVGKVVSSLAPADIGAEINAMLADHTALTHMSDSALNAAQKTLCWQQEAKHLLHVYFNILNADDDLQKVLSYFSSAHNISLGE
jgi:glycosyltransferase involved in cell wall biosynthesis